MTGVPDLGLDCRPLWKGADGSFHTKESAALFPALARTARWCGRFFVPNRGQGPETKNVACIDCRLRRFMSLSTVLVVTEDPAQCEPVCELLRNGLCYRCATDGGILHPAAGRAVSTMPPFG